MMPADMQPTREQPSIWPTIREFEDPTFRLQCALGELPVPLSDSREIYDALVELGRFDRGETHELTGLAAWLDFLRNPYADDEPLWVGDAPTADDRELSGTIAAAVLWARTHPYRDPMDGLEEFAMKTDAQPAAVIEMPTPAAYRRTERAAAQQDVRAEPVVRPDATPGFDAFQKACEDRGFKRTWDHKRPDLPDQSIATYDLELAKIALRFGWNDQQIVDLLIWHRTTQIEPPEDAPYYLATLKKAKSGTAPDGAETAGGSDGASTLLPILNRELGIQIERIVKYGANGGTFELQLASGHRVDLGTTEDVLNQRRVKARIADATAEVIPGFGSARWDKIARAIFRCAGLAPVEESPEQIEMTWLLRSRLADTSVIDIDERDRAGLTKIIRAEQVSGGWAFRDHTGCLLIHLGGLCAAIRLKHGMLLTFREAGTRLRKMGFTPRDLDGKPDNHGKARLNVWAAPRGWE